MTPDELRELMEEAPGGEPHGRVRTEGGWRDLSHGSDFAQLPFIIDDPEYRQAQSYAHGTRSRYVTGCRCGLCRRANRDYQRSRRAGAAGTPQEP